MSGAANSIDELRDLVDIDPQRALATCQALLDTPSLDHREIAELYWVMALADRSLGDFAGARNALEIAHQHANACDDRALRVQVMVGLAVEVGTAGDLPRALALFEDADVSADQGERAALLFQRGLIHYRLGRLSEAVEDALLSRKAAAMVGDRLSELKALVNLGAFESQRDVARARQVLLEAVSIAADLMQVSWGATAFANLAYVEALDGNLPEALDAFAAAEDGYRETGTLGYLPRLYADRALALADGRMLGDAEELIDRAVELSAASGADVELAELLLISAEIDLALDKADEAYVSAENAVAAFTRQGRESWLHVAERLRLRAKARLAPDAPDTAAGLVENGRALAAEGWRSDALGSLLLAALLYVEQGRVTEAREILDDVGTAAVRGRTADRILFARVMAELAIQLGDRRAARRAVRVGLDVAAASQAALGSLETRSLAAHHGAELIELGARLAIEDRRPRELLQRIEAMRTMVWRAPLVRAPDDTAMANLLAELRRASAAAADPDADPDERARADRQRLRLEREVRALSRRARGRRGEATTTEDAVAEAIAELGDRDLLAYANLGGRLYAVAVRRGRTALHDLGDVAALDEHLEVCAFALHRLNRVQGSEASREAARQLLEEGSDALADQLLPRAVARSDRPLVLVPTGALHGVPWTALAPLRGRPVSVSPSLSGWAAASQAAAGRAGLRRDRPAAFVAGPALHFADAEIEELSTAYERATVVPSTESTAEQVVELFGSSELVHLACHGAFRTDNPLFSTLALGDGPLTVYDLERAAAMPGVVVLSACSVGTSASINGGTLLGLSSALGAFGASDVIAPLTPVNDEHVLDVMRRIHAGLAAGDSPAAALAAAVDGGELDPVAAAFVVIGA